MLMSCDRFFVAEMQKNGYDVDYKKLVAIYRASRQSPAYLRRRQQRMAEEAQMMAMYDQMVAAEEAEKVAKPKKKVVGKRVPKKQRRAKK